MSDKPTIHLSNFSSYKTEGHHGSGRIFSIMYRTPPWSPALGVVSALVPDGEDLWALRDQEITMDEYQERYEGKITTKGDILAPGRLIVASKKQLNHYQVANNDTLCCTCARAAAARGECHRAWAAPFLVGSGWDVILDGKRVY